MRSRVHYAWVVAAISFLILLVGAGVRATPSILIVPLREEFGWSSATTGAAIAVNIFLYGMLGPFAVAIFERFGLARSVACALAVIAGGIGASVFMTSAWQMMLLWGLLVGAGVGMIGLVIVATVANRWFAQRRGLVVGILSASTATGQLIFLPFLAQIVMDHGWRTAILVVAATALALIVPTLWLLPDYPADIGLPRLGEDEITSRPGSVGNPILRAFRALGTGLRNRDFWLLAGSFMVCGASTNGLIGTHLIAACADHGIPEIRAAGLLAMMGVLDLVGTTFSGWLTDRYDGRVLLAIYYGLRGLSLLFLPQAFDMTVYGLPLFAIFYGLDWIATVPPTVRLAGAAFGEGNAALMYGWIAASHQIGAALAAWAAGFVRAESGNYAPAFVAAGLLCVLAALMVLFIGGEARGRTREATALAGEA